MNHDIHRGLSGQHWRIIHLHGTFLTGKQTVSYFVGKIILHFYLSLKNKLHCSLLGNLKMQIKDKISGNLKCSLPKHLTNEVSK